MIRMWNTGWPTFTIAELPLVTSPADTPVSALSGGGALSLLTPAHTQHKAYLLKSEHKAEWGGNIGMAWFEAGPGTMKWEKISLTFWNQYNKGNYGTVSKTV